MKTVSLNKEEELELLNILNQSSSNLKDKYIERINNACSFLDPSFFSENLSNQVYLTGISGNWNCGAITGDIPILEVSDGNKVRFLHSSDPLLSGKMVPGIGTVQILDEDIPYYGRLNK